MKFDPPLIEGQLLRRYKRFFADVRLNDGREVVAHVPNTGSLRGCLAPGQACWIQPATDPNRKLRYTLQLLQSPSGALVGVNTQNPPRLIAEVLAQSLLPHWRTYDRHQWEVPLSRETRIDLVLWRSQDLPGIKKIEIAKMSAIELRYLHLVELKNVTLAENSLALFPDSRTERGEKHLRELITWRESHGATTEMLYVIQRADVEEFAPAQHIDPGYTEAFRDGQIAGVLVTALSWEVTPGELRARASTLPIK